MLHPHSITGSGQLDRIHAFQAAGTEGRQGKIEIISHQLQPVIGSRINIAFDQAILTGSL